MYAIVDLETTGVKAIRDRITEIAIALHDGEKVIQEFQTLVNPECSIPYNITQITGISNEMVADAPKFYEVAKQVVELTKGAIFVAHNVSFDYNFIKEEFSRLGYTFRRKQLCTVRLSKLVFPKRRRYSLDAMIDMLDITVERRHRAMDDVRATVKLFEAILQERNAQDSIDSLVNRGVSASKLPPNFTLEKLHALPESCGVYYFHNQHKEVIYVGKSINIKKRVMEHFANKTAKAKKMQQEVRDITHQETGSELVALLLESHEIKNIKPIYNTAQKPRRKTYCIFTYTDEKGYLCLSVAKRTTSMNVVADYSRREDAAGTLRFLREEYELCNHKLELEKGEGPCFQYHIKQCKGACMAEEPVESYNERAQAAINRLTYPELEKSFILLEAGRTKQEKAIVVVEDGIYKGFGYVDTEENLSLENLVDAITPYKHNLDIVRIILQYMKSKPIQRIKF